MGSRGGHGGGGLPAPGGRGPGGGSGEEAACWQSLRSAGAPPRGKKPLHGRPPGGRKGLAGGRKPALPPDPACPAPLTPARCPVPPHCPRIPAGRAIRHGCWHRVHGGPPAGLPGPPGFLNEAGRGESLLAPSPALSHICSSKGEGEVYQRKAFLGGKRTPEMGE